MYVSFYLVLSFTKKQASYKNVQNSFLFQTVRKKITLVSYHHSVIEYHYRARE